MTYKQIWPRVWGRDWESACFINWRRTNRNHSHGKIPAKYKANLSFQLVLVGNTKSKGKTLLHSANPKLSLRSLKNFYQLSENRSLKQFWFVLESNLVFSVLRKSSSAPLSGNDLLKKKVSCYIPSHCSVSLHCNCSREYIQPGPQACPSKFSWWHVLFSHCF